MNSSGNQCFFSYGDVRSTGTKHTNFTSSFLGWLRADGHCLAMGVVLAGFVAGLQLLKNLQAGGGDENVRIFAEGSRCDLYDLLGGFSPSEDDFGNTVAQTAMVVHLGKSKVLVG